MTYTTSDRHDPNINASAGPGLQNRAYIVLSDEERSRGFVRPVRAEYIHDTCRTRTLMDRKIAETYAREPQFYGRTWCCHCLAHLPVGEFRWVADRTVVGS